MDFFELGNLDSMRDWGHAKVLLFFFLKGGGGGVMTSKLKQ